MRGNELACFQVTMREEGGAELSLVRSDSGNWSSGRVDVGELLGSRYGVSAPVALAHGVRPASLTEQQALAIVYVPDYWDKCAAAVLPVGIDCSVVDHAYNAGVKEALILYGEACARASDTHGRISAFATLRLSFYRSLRNFSIDGKGWSARVARVEADSLRMSQAPAETVQAAADTAQAKSSASAKSAMAAPIVAVAVAAAVPGHAVQHALSEGQILAIAAAVVIVGAAIAAALFWKARGHAVRADTLQSLAAEVTAQAASQGRGKS